MIAKLIVWGEDRGVAVRRLAAALAEYEVVGVQTNLGLLRAIAAHPAFARAELDTGFIARHAGALLPDAGLSDAAQTTILAAAALAVLSDRRAARAAEAATSADPWSPWNVADAWRMNGDGYQDLMLRLAEDAVTLRSPSNRERDLSVGPATRVGACRGDRACRNRNDAVHRWRAAPAARGAP